MPFPSELVIKATLKVGVVYKIVAPEFISTDVPHYFVVVAICEDDNYLLLSTTQLDKKIDYLNKRGIDLNTLAYIQPNKGNGLTDKSYFNCNDYHVISRSKLVAKVDEGKLHPKGNINAEEYEKLVDAIKISDLNDIPHSLLEFK